MKLKFFYGYLFACSVAAGTLIYLATSKIGPGISTDASYYLSAGFNLVRGNGLIDFEGHELTQFPPIYSMLLALGSLILGQDVFIVGRFLNVLVFSALVWAGGVYFYKSFESELLFAYLGSFVILTSTSLIQISANIAPDLLFLLLVLGFLFSVANYIKTKDSRWAILSGVLTILGCFLRYAGLSIVVAGTMLMVYANRESIRKSVISAGIFCLATAVPIVLWGVLHNYPVNRSVFGIRLPSVPAINFGAGVEKILYWFIPHQIITAFGAVPLLMLFLAAAFAVVIATGYKEFLKVVQSPTVIAGIVFLLVYSYVLIFNISSPELKGLNKDRVHVIILPMLLAALFSAAYRLIEVAKVRFNSRLVYGAVIFLFLLWEVYPISKSMEYIRNSMQYGDVSANNNFNRTSFWNSSFVRFVENFDVGGGKIYTNYRDSVWYIFRRQVSVPPYNADMKTSPTKAYLEQHYENWPGPGNEGYLIWFKSAESKEYYATPDQIAVIADLTEIYSDPDGSIFYVKSR